MDIRILKYFLTVAKEENITRAAEILHISQPSLSQQLKELELELGKQLLIRGKRKTTLTEDGFLLRQRAEDIVELMDKTKQDIMSNNNQIAGRITMGGNPTNYVLQTAALMKKLYPLVNFNFYVADATDITEKLKHGNLDFAVLLKPIDNTKFKYFSLPDKSLWGVLMPKSHPLAKLATIKKENLLQLPLIMHRRNGLQQVIADWMETDIEKLNITATYNVIHGNPAKFVNKGLGCFLLTRDLLPDILEDNMVFRPLEPTLAIHYNLVWKRHASHNPAAKAFLDIIQNSMDKNQLRTAE